MVKFLLNAGASTNDRDEAGMYPLHYAAHGGHQDVVNFLLEKHVKLSIIL